MNNTLSERSATTLTYFFSSIVKTPSIAMKALEIVNKSNPELKEIYDFLSRYNLCHTNFFHMVIDLHKSNLTHGASVASILESVLNHYYK